MNRITRSTMRRLTPRTMVIGGAALGLVAGVTVYGAVSSAAEVRTPASFKAPVAAPARFADCAAGAKLEKGVCVIHVVRTVVAPSAASAADGTPADGATPGSTAKPSSPALPGSGAKPANPAQPSAASASPATGGGDDDEGAQSAAPTAAPLSAYDAAVLASKNAAALASKDAATLGANNPTTLAAQKAATLAAQKAASLAPVNAG
jgi:hypothetical protein